MDSVPRHDEGQIKSAIQQFKMASYEFYEHLYFDEVTDMLSALSSLLDGVISHVTKERDDSVVHQIALLSMNGIRNVSRRSVYLLVSYCFDSSDTTLQCDGITLVESFPFFGLAEQFADMYFSIVSCNENGKDRNRN